MPDRLWMGERWTWLNGLARCDSCAGMTAGLWQAPDGATLVCPECLELAR